jgi:hypothetical protein
VGSPDRHQVEQAAAAGVDHVLGQQLLAQVHGILPEPEEGDHLGDAVVLGERAAEAGDLVLRVAARGRQEADARPRRPGELHDQIADRVVADPPVEVVAAESQDAAHLRQPGARPG